MHTDSKAEAAAELAAHFTTNGYGHAASLVLEPYGEGYAWLRPSTDAAEDDDALYVITDRGRRDLRMVDCFGPWPTVAEVSV